MDARAFVAVIFYRSAEKTDTPPALLAEIRLSADIRRRAFAFLFRVRKIAVRTAQTARCRESRTARH